MKCVLTGGPCVGKTTIVELLASMGYEIVPEVARMVIERETIKQSDMLPGKNLKEFQRLVAEEQYEIEKGIKGPVTFLDRGIVDGKAFCILGNVPVSEIVDRVAPGRYDKVFVLDRLPEYKNDSERKESAEEAALIHTRIVDCYVELGYEPIVVPVLPPEDRVRFILDRVGV